MGQIEDLSLFVQILESGSISKAAARLNLAKSAISRRLAILEKRYATSLIDRTPGKWQVTDTGTELYRRALRVIDDLEEINTDFTSHTTNLNGPLAVSVPRDFGLGYLSNALTAFKVKYPQIELTVDFDDRLVDLHRENYDFAIRITGSMDDSEAATRIGSVEHALFASRRYLKTHVEPQSVDELRDHPLLHYGNARRATWRFGTGKSSSRLNFSPALNSNSGLFLLDATLKGLGISRLPDFITHKAVDDGSLIRILPDVASPSSGIFILHHANRPMTRRMRAFAEEINEACLSNK